MKKINILVVAVLLSLTLSLTLSATAATLTRQLQLGMSGSDVSSLQSFLAQDPTIYPQGLITGYFGTLTRNAVINFQARNGISTVGRVGPITLAAINAQMVLGMGTGTQSDPAPWLSNISVNTSSNSATISWNTNENATGRVHYNSSPLSVSESYTDVFVNGGYVTQQDNNMNAYKNISLSGLQSNTTYYYMIYTKDASGNVTVSWPSTFRTQ